ncbi:MAG: iron-containing redox enzyme family protein [Iphinoe sp. HA4291-MV1]|jgi:pyrroloquinoline-quinone synthase|nr:iron-containing redox enzyme family protein [Iphinoe sp. HA4291-MV1]
MTSTTIKRFEEVEDPNIRKRVKLDNQETKKYLDEQIEYILAHRAVEHPFLNYYRKNKLTKEQEKKLFLECFYFFQYLPFYITGMALHTRDENILREVILNVIDEVGSKVTHSMIYRDFLHQIGITNEEFENYKCLPTTTALNQGIMKLYTEPPIEKCLGALYADETMSATMVSKLNDGLENQEYDKKLRNFWLIHINVEVGHSNNVFNAISPYISEQDTRELFEKGMNGFLELVATYWDGVEALLLGNQT